jgi:hypothetical protein
MISKECLIRDYFIPIVSKCLCTLDYRSTPICCHTGSWIVLSHSFVCDINNVVCKQVITIIIGENIFVQLGFSSKVPCRVTSGRLYFDSLVAQTFCTEFRMADKRPAAPK